MRVTAKAISWLTTLSMVQLLGAPSNVAHASTVANQYIVVFAEQSPSNTSLLASGETVRQAAERLVAEARQHQLLLDDETGIDTAQNEVQISLGFVYESALQGFSATLTPDAVSLLETKPEVDYIEQDTVVELNVTQSPTPAWGLDRIDQRDLPLDQSFSYTFNGSGIHAYVIDSGIRATHNQFGGRVGNGFDFIDNDTVPNDCRGHGTHVAGTLGGFSYGVARNVTLHAVRIFNCTGGTFASTVIAAVDWVRINRQLPAVANMSLGGPASAAMDAAVRNLIASGVTTVVSAGNESVDACTRSPARVATAITVASSTATDQRSPSSNFGPCVDIFAPGNGIASAWYTSDTATITLSGTSMAAPHAAGVAASYLHSESTLTTTDVHAGIVNAATTNHISNPGSGSPNKLLYSVRNNSGPVSCPARNTQVAYACSSGVTGAAQTAARVCCNGYRSAPQGGAGCYAFYCN